jgi:copper transport protein
MACWLGGLVVMFAVVMPRKDADEMRSVLVRFSGLALACVVALVVTGAFQGYRQVGSINALKDTDYGRILIVKVVVFAALIVAAAFSREVVNRQFRTYDDDDEDELDDGEREQRVDVLAASHAEPVAVGAGTGTRRFFGGGSSLPDAPEGDESAHGDDDDDDWEPPDFDTDVRRLRRSLFIEIVIATVVLAVTALLVNAAPALTVSNEPVSLALRNSKVWVDVTLAPGNAGGNDIHVTALPVGGGLTTIADLQMQLVKKGADLPPFDVPLLKLGEGHYYAPLFDIPYPGEWQMVVRARLTETEDTVVTGKFSLR